MICLHTVKYLFSWRIYATMVLKGLISCMYIQKLKSCIDRNTVYHKITSRKLAQCTWFKNLPDCSLKVLPLLPLVGLDTNHPNNDPTTGMFFSTLWNITKQYFIIIIVYVITGAMMPTSSCNIFSFSMARSFWAASIPFTIISDIPSMYYSEKQVDGALFL